jgi:hypothetical protein
MGCWDWICCFWSINRRATEIPSLSLVWPAIVMRVQLIGSSCGGDDDWFLKGSFASDAPPFLYPHRRPLLYIIPVHHNPLGVTLPAASRRRLLRLAHRCQLTIIADEVYQVGALQGRWFYW